MISAMRFASWALLLALAAAPLGSLPTPEKCCPMAGTGMACCELESGSATGCQIRRCTPGSGVVAVVGARADVAPSTAGLPMPAVSVAHDSDMPALPILEPPSPPVPPPRA
jgi:L-aminopeptidase/D-esterase-like protein